MMLITLPSQCEGWLFKDFTQTRRSFLNDGSVPQTDVSAYQNAAPCTNGRFDGPHRSILRWQ